MRQSNNTPSQSPSEKQRIKPPQKIVDSVIAEARRATQKIRECQGNVAHLPKLLRKTIIEIRNLKADQIELDDEELNEENLKQLGINLIQNLISLQAYPQAQEAADDLNMKYPNDPKILWLIAGAYEYKTFIVKKVLQQILEIDPEYKFITRILLKIYQTNQDCLFKTVDALIKITNGELQGKLIDLETSLEAEDSLDINYYFASLAMYQKDFELAKELINESQFTPIRERRILIRSYIFLNQLKKAKQHIFEIKKIQNKIDTQEAIDLIIIAAIKRNEKGLKLWSKQLNSEQVQEAITILRNHDRAEEAQFIEQTLTINNN